MQEEVATRAGEFNTQQLANIFWAYITIAAAALAEPPSPHLLRCLKVRRPRLAKKP